jgi:hypothetical protein
MLEMDDATANDISDRAMFSDMLVAYPTILNYKAYREVGTGSWYIQELCKIFGNKDYTNIYEIRGLYDLVAENLSKRTGQGDKIGDKIIQNSEYRVLGMSKKLYLPKR